MRLIPPAYAKAYVRRNKNDAADAAAICEAVSRPSMRLMTIKTAEQQAAAGLQRVRELLVKQRTMLMKACPGAAAGRLGELDAELEGPGAPDRGCRAADPGLGSRGDELRLGPISKRGNGYPRRLLVNGAMSVLSSRGGKQDPWLVKLLETKKRKVAAVALANKMARIAWAVMMRQEDFRARPVAA